MSQISKSGVGPYDMPGFTRAVRALNKCGQYSVKEFIHLANINKYFWNRGKLKCTHKTWRSRRYIQIHKGKGGEDADGVQQQRREERNGVLCRVRPLGIDAHPTETNWEPLLGIDTERHVSLGHAPPLGLMAGTVVLHNSSFQEADYALAAEIASTLSLNPPAHLLTFGCIARTSFNFLAHLSDRGQVYYASSDAFSAITLALLCTTHF